MTGICFFIKVNKIEENVYKYILSKLDLGGCPEILDHSECNDATKLDSICYFKN